MLIGFNANNIVSSVDATKSGAYRKDIQGLPPPRKDKVTDKKNIAWGDVFFETFCGSRYSVVVAFLEVSRIDFRIDERSG